MHETKKVRLINAAMRLLVTFSVSLLAGCVWFETDDYIDPQREWYETDDHADSQERWRPGSKRFGYAGVSIGKAGLPGQDDIRPGPVVTVTFPPQGVALVVVPVGAAAFALYTMDFNFNIQLGSLAGYELYDFMSQGSSIDKATGFGWDAILSFSQQEDLTYGGDVFTPSACLGVRYIDGLWGKAFLHLLAGLQCTWMNFDYRATEFNSGLYVGTGVEFLSSDEAGINCTVRYAFLGGKYDYWETTIGLAWYW